LKRERPRRARAARAAPERAHDRALRARREAGYAAAHRPHAHHYTILAVAAAKAGDELRVAATGAGPHAVRLRAVEQSGDPGDALKDASPSDDALASAWYRTKILPRLVQQALDFLADGEKI